MPNVFNGDFENGIRQSLMNRIPLFASEDKFRFPLSYEVPGWSFHGGKGFSLGLDPSYFGSGLPDGLPTDIDVTGLFVFETNPGQLAAGLAKWIWKTISDKVVGALMGKLKTDAIGKEPEKPTSSSTEGYKTWYNTNWGEGTPNRIAFDGSSALYDLVKGVTGWLDQKNAEMNEVVLGPIKNVLKIDEVTKKLNPDGAKNFKEYIEKGLEKLFQYLFSPSSNYALLMGGVRRSTGCCA